MDQYPGKQRHYQQSAGWTGSGAKAIKLLYTDFSIIIGSVYLFLPLMIVTVAGVMEILTMT